MSNIKDKIQETISYSLNVTKNFKFPQEIPNSPNPLKLTKWYTNEVSTITSEIMKIENDCNITCTCSKGCSSCCKQLIFVFKVEVLAIIPLIENLDKITSRDLKQKINAQCSLLTKYEITEDKIQSFHSEKILNNLQDKYFSLNLECPFLNNNECIIYPVRPLVCWSYKYYGDPQQCKTSFRLPDSIKYNDWELAETRRILTAKRSSSKNYGILQFTLKNLLHI